jgi:hypothetical protein
MGREAPSPPAFRQLSHTTRRTKENKHKWSAPCLKPPSAMQVFQLLQIPAVGDQRLSACLTSRECSAKLECTRARFNRQASSKRPFLHGRVFYCVTCLALCCRESPHSVQALQMAAAPKFNKHPCRIGRFQLTCCAKGEKYVQSSTA